MKELHRLVFVAGLQSRVRQLVQFEARSAAFAEAAVVNRQRIDSGRAELLRHRLPRRTPAFYADGAAFFADGAAFFADGAAFFADGAAFFADGAAFFADCAAFLRRRC